MVENACKDAEAVVHAAGLLFGVTTPGLNLIVSVKRECDIIDY